MPEPKCSSCNGLKSEPPKPGGLATRCYRPSEHAHPEGQVWVWMKAQGPSRPARWELRGLGLKT